MRPCHRRNAAKLVFLVSTIVVSSMTIMMLQPSQNSSAVNLQDNGINNYVEAETDSQSQTNSLGQWRHLGGQRAASLSRLGRILFLEEERPPPKNQNFTILVWKYGPTTHRRHMKQYTDQEIDPFLNCAASNCKVTYEDKYLENADAVILHLHRTKGVDDLPKTRKPSQIWIFLTDESPHHTFLNGKQNLSNYNGFFNWSMNYRMDADVPVPYGRTIAKKVVSDNFHFDVDSWMMTKNSDVLVTIMGSNCGSTNHRWQYVSELKKWIDVDVYGGCGTLKCPGHFTKDCPLISRYLFYLAFENSNCNGYITEKLWWNAYTKNAVPVVMGGSPSQTDYAELLPPGSYINVDDFATPRDLAAYLKYLAKTPAELEQYFQWRKYFSVVNEHGYFQTKSYHYCRICEALNYNDRAPKTYHDLENYWNSKKDCSSAWDATFD